MALEGTQQQKEFFIELWDVGGSHSQRNTRHVFMQTVHGVILVHDLNNRKSCLNLGRWLAEVNRAEGGTNRQRVAGAGGAWDGGNISGTDIGEVRRQQYREVLEGWLCLAAQLLVKS